MPTSGATAIRLQDGGLNRNADNQLILPLILFALETAMRRGEIVSVTWNNVDLAIGHFISRTRRTAIPGPFR